MPDLLVRFVTERDLISRAIRWVTFSDFSHVELGLPDGTWLGAHASGGVQIRPAGYMTPSLERVYALAVTQAEYDAAMAYARGQIGTSYSFLDIANILFRARFSTRPHGIICSWFMLEVLRAASITALNVLAEYDYKITPDMLHLSPIFIGKCIRQTAKPVWRIQPAERGTS